MAGFHSTSTRAVRGDRTPGDRSGPLVTPLVQSTTYLREDVDLPVEHAYSRVSNPTVSALERHLGLLEDAPPSVCFASGLAAVTALLLATVRVGDHVVCGSAVYGGTVRLLEQVFDGLGVASTFVPSEQPDEVTRSLRGSTKLVIVESPANPTLSLTDIASISRITRPHGALLAVDNTFLTPIGQRPLDLGADVSVYSTTKLIEGHSAALGGALTARDEGLLERLRFIRKSTGAIQAPFNAWLTIQGIKTLPIRLCAQSASALHIAESLVQHNAVATVHYPGLPDFPQRALAQRQHLAGHGNVVSIDLKGGRAAAEQFVRELELCCAVEHVGSVETLVTHSASMTHADVRPEHRLAVGITDGLVRLSIGLEAPDEILADLTQALDRVSSRPARTPDVERRTACLATASSF